MSPLAYFWLLALIYGALIGVMIQVGTVSIPRDFKRPATFGLGLTFTIGSVGLAIISYVLGTLVDGGDMGMGVMVLLIYPVIILGLAGAGAALLAAYFIKRRIEKVRLKRQAPKAKAGPAAVVRNPEPGPPRNPGPSPKRPNRHSSKKKRRRGG